MSSFESILESIKFKFIKSNISLDCFTDYLYSANRVFIVGVGRSGLVGKLFTMRLMHIGKMVYMVGEVTTPKIKKDDLMVAISGSGSTSTVVRSAKIAKSAGAKIFTLTAKENSPLAKLSDDILLFNVKSKFDGVDNLLPLGTAFELITLLTLESTISHLMERLNINEEFLKERHTNFEL
jgi:6-phospho 3-hexuloisomerase